MEKFDSELCQWIALYTNYFNFEFFIFIHFTNQLTLKPGLTQKLKLTFKFITIKGQINLSRWTQMGHKGWRKDRKTFLCYTIALKFWDEFNSNFVLLHFSSYSSIKLWHLYLKNMEKNNKVVHLRLVLLIFILVQ